MLLKQKIKKVYTSNTHKNEGLMYDYKNVDNYISVAQNKINNLFDKIHTF